MDLTSPAIVNFNMLPQSDCVLMTVALARRSGTDDSGATPIEEYVQQPYEDWTSRGSRTTNSSALSRGRSIKALVQRFEELDASENAPIRTPNDSPGLSAPFFKAAKKTSPLRQSIRNLVSVFKKASRDKDEPVATPYTVVEGYPMQNKDPGSSYCASPSSFGALQSGNVLHLSPPDGTSTILPLWTHYHAELHAKHILLYSDTAHGLPVSKVLSLFGCSDVYSVSSRELGAEERALMPVLGISDSPVVFDLVFDDKTERFAVSTARERAAWVNTVLNAVLRTSTDAFSPLNEDEAEKPALWIDTTTTALASISVQDDLLVTPPPQPSSLMRRDRVFRKERDLPPVPQSSTPVQTGLETLDSSLPRSIYQQSTLSTPIASPTKIPGSPSVINLSRQSVVRQRLAEMEHQVSSASESFYGSSRSPFTTSAPSPLRTAQTSLDSGPHRLKEMPASPSPDDRMQSTSSQSHNDVHVPKSPFRKRHELRQLAVRQAQHEPAAAVSLDGIAANTLLDIINDDHSRHALDGIRDRVEVAAKDIGVVRQTLEGVASCTHGDSKLLASLVGRVDEIKNTLAQQTRDHVMHNEKRGGTSDQVVTLALREINGKLDTMAKTPTVTEMLELVRDANEQRALQESQGAENTRYLAELNAWLEAFVNHGSSHLQGISDAVNNITQEICPLPMNESQDGSPTTQRSTLLGSLHELIARSRHQEQENVAQRQELHALVTAMHEDMRLNAEMRNVYSTQSVMEHMTRQQEEYGTMLKVVSNTLFDEIRGERLRFVDAMQEATAINVHRHVNDLKGELAREIASMTKRVAYLQRTSHEWEARIAELLTFYNSQGGQQSQTVQHPLNISQLAVRPAKLDMPRAGRARKSDIHGSRKGTGSKLSPIEERSPMDARSSSSPFSQHSSPSGDVAPASARRRPLPYAPV